MKKWEYRFYNRRGAAWHEILQDLNELGDKGWEMVASDFEVREEANDKVLYYHSVLKRPKVS
ncbi:MAG TPA: hypothetical protein VK463_05475 [Desulfomonilaceae bacterium]|nr:hypothetical protein [Desulfomonilaceae bacterium]